MNTTRLTALAVSIALAGALAACSDPAPASVPGATSATSASAATSATAAPSQVADDAPTATHAEPDTAFAQLMTIHHEVAVEMAILAETNAGSQDVLDLAAAISAAQGPEIETMTWWLESWGEDSAARAAVDGLDHTGMQMDGLTEEEAMFELGGLTGAEFDRRFLELMVSHHEGAVVMAQEEIDGGVNAEAIALAQSIVTAQTAEIVRMQGMLTAV